MVFEAKNISFNINNVEILNDISFNIQSNQLTSIMGPNGSGKSSILKLIIGEIQPTHGTINPIPYDQITYLPQTMVDPPFVSVLEIIIMGMKLRKISKTKKLKIAYEISKECGIESLLNRNFDSLSGGEKQRAWLSFCLAQNKEIILLDEPLSSIDHNSREEFYKTLHEISKKSKTLIIVTHDNELSVKHSDQIIYINDGEIKFAGLSSDFISNSME